MGKVRQLPVYLKELDLVGDVTKMLDYDGEDGSQLVG